MWSVSPRTFEQCYNSVLQLPYNYTAGTNRGGDTKLKRCLARVLVTVLYSVVLCSSILGPSSIGHHGKTIRSEDCIYYIALHPRPFVFVCVVHKELTMNTSIPVLAKLQSELFHGNHSQLQAIRTSLTVHNLNNLILA